MAGAGAVCHLAARTQVRESFTDPVGYYDVNVGGTVAVLAALAATAPARPPAFVYASTLAVYGLADDYPVSEEAPVRPTTPYAASKAAAEDVVRFTAQAGGIGAMILRMANASGSVQGRAGRDAALIPRAVAVAAGRFPHVDVNGDGSARREYLHVLDAADACVRALERATPGAAETLNVGSDRAVSVAEVLAATERVTGRSVATVVHPPAPEPPLVCADSARARSRLGWAPTRSDLDRLVADAWAAEQARARQTSLRTSS